MALDQARSKARGMIGGAARDGEGEFRRGGAKPRRERCVEVGIGREQRLEPGRRLERFLQHAGWRRHPTLRIPIALQPVIYAFAAWRRDGAPKPISRA